MDRTIIAVHRMLDALSAATYDIGILSDRGMFPGHGKSHKRSSLGQDQFPEEPETRAEPTSTSVHRECTI